MSFVQKGEKFKIPSGLNNLIIGIGWDLNKDGKDIDLDACAFMLDKNEEVRDKKDFVYYKNLKDPSGALIHSGDNLTGEGDGDDEQITVDLSKIPNEISHITFVVSIYEALERQQTFGMVENAYIRIENTNSNEEILRYNLEKEFYNSTSVLVGDIVKIQKDWYFDAVGIAFSGGLKAIASDFDIDYKK